MYGYNTEKKGTNMRTLSVMAAKLPMQTLDVSPQFGRQSPLGGYAGEDLRDSIKRVRESNAYNSLDKKKAKSVLRNAKNTTTKTL